MKLASRIRAEAGLVLAPAMLSMALTAHLRADHQPTWDQLRPS
jgi:hypothetical protein